MAKKERKKKEKREKSVIIAQSCDHESTTRRCKDEVAVGRLFIHGCQEISALTVGGAAVRIGERVLHCSAGTERQMFLIRCSYAIAKITLTARIVRLSINIIANVMTCHSAGSAY